MGIVETSQKPSFQEALAVWAKIGIRPHSRNH
jgi:hypothetical protein